MEETGDPASLDEATKVALCAAAGNLQGDAAAVGFLRVTEADARRALCRGLQLQLGASVWPEAACLSHEKWPGRLGAFDVAVVDKGGSVRAAYELKWCRERDKFAEALWDALKLCLFMGDGSLEVAYLVYAAAVSSWESGPYRPVELFDAAEHSVAKLLAAYDSAWKWLLRGNETARPRELPARFRTRPVGSVPIHSARGEGWKVSCVRIDPLPGSVVQFDERGFPAIDRSGTEA